MSRTRFAKVCAKWQEGGPPPRWRSALALLLSLLAHALLLSLTFDGQGMGLPGIGLPWQERRGAVPELLVVLNSTHGGPAQVATEPAPTPPAALQPRQPPTAAAPAANAPPSVSDTQPEPPLLAAPPRAVAAVTQSDGATWTVPVASKPLTPIAAAVPHAPEPPPRAEPPADDAERERLNQRAREAAQLEAAQLEAARQEAAQREAAQREAAQLEAAQREAARQETERHAAAARLAAAQLDAERQAAAQAQVQRAQAARLEAERLEAARDEAARLEATRLEAERRAAMQQEAARQDAQRQEAERQKAARLAEAQAAAERREARLREIGRQLDEEAAQRQAAEAARQAGQALPSSYSSARRGRLFGRSDANEELVRYAEALARKIHLNRTFEMVRDALKPGYANPVVTLAVRADGSVESVTFVRSSGVPALDDAIRRVVRSQEHYAAFPPALAREYDVIEIRRTWSFDAAIWLQ